MPQEFETTFNSFIAKSKEHMMSHAAFVQYVYESLVSLNEVTISPKQKVPLKHSTLQTRKDILIVDDAEINRVLMSYFFKNLPVILEYACSGEQAIEKTTHKNFDLILMDLQMKGMSGIEAMKAIRAQNPASKTQILAITNLEPSDEEQAEVLAAGATVYLSKSMSREAMREKVSEYLLDDSSSVA